jgi:uncharacterized protein (TIGR02391 family)
MCRQSIPPFAVEHLAAIAKVLGDTDDGLTGSEIGYQLQNCRTPDPTPDMTKWKRLFNAFVEFQNVHRVGNHVVVFINRAMTPASYTDCPDLFRDRKDRLNTILAFCGMEVRDNGKVSRATRAANLDEALQRANRLKAALTQRGVHQDVLEHCKAEFLRQNYFHAVFEAMKSITMKIRTLSGLTGDGAQLVDEVFGFGKSGHPMLAINQLDTDTLRGEQRGFISLLKGLYGTVRNPLAHEPKMEWDVSEQDALDILTTLSFVHRKLDKAHPYDPNSQHRQPS